jgi:hypothetical protein
MPLLAQPISRRRTKKLLTAILAFFEKSEHSRGARRDLAGVEPVIYNVDWESALCFDFAG